MVSRVTEIDLNAARMDVSIDLSQQYNPLRKRKDITHSES